MQPKNYCGYREKGGKTGGRVYTEIILALKHLRAWQSKAA